MCRSRFHSSKPRSWPRTQISQSSSSDYPLVVTLNILVEESVSSNHIARIRPRIVNYMFQIHHLHCYSSSPKFDHYYDVMPLLHHICNIFMQTIKSVISKLMEIVIQGVHCETMASNLIVNVIVHWVLCCYGRLSPTATFWSLKA